MQGKICRKCGKVIIEGKDIYREITHYYLGDTASTGGRISIKEHECWPSCPKGAK